MKPAIIDNSLVNLKFNEDADKKEVFMYVCSLIEAGASYVELGLNALTRLPKPSGTERYIYRINGSEEYIVANAFSFSYALVPIKYSYLIPKLDLPVILEVDTGDVDLFSMLAIVGDNIDLTKLDMIRIIGDFTPEAISAIIKKYRRRYAIPLDICPKSNSLGALSCAIAAYKAETDAVTVSFGDNSGYASLEEFLIMLTAVFGTLVSAEYLSGICKASLILPVIGCSATTNLNIMMKKYMYRPFEIVNIDSEAAETDARPVNYGSAYAGRKSVTEKMLASLEVEQEISDKILDILKKLNMELSVRREGGLLH